MAEAEIFFSEEKKKHHRFMEIKEEEMRLLLNEEEMKMKLGEAVETGIIGNEALAYYMALTKNFLLTVGIDENKLRFRKHKEDELAHYANECWDAELYSERFGWIECVGIADRSAYDLQAHMKASGAEMRVFEKYEEPRIEKRKVIRLKMDKIGPIFKDKAKIVKEKLENMEIGNEEKITVEIDGKVYEIGKELYEIEEIEEKVTGRRYIPHVIEPSYGIDRIFYFILEHNYKETKKEGEKYVILSLPACIAPIKAGVFPLVNKDGLPEIAREIEKGLRKKGIMVVYDDGGSIGRRYARMDEIGTPFCVTVDYQTKEDDTITIRFRDTTEQIRLQRQKLADWLKERIEF